MKPRTEVFVLLGVGLLFCSFLVVGLVSFCIWLKTIESLLWIIQ